MNITDEKKIDILIHFQNTQYQELMFRRKREFNIFLWTATVFIVLIGTLLTLETSNILLWQSYGICGKAAICLIVLLMVFISISWQNRERRFSYTNCKVIVKINSALQAFENNAYMATDDTLFPERWKKWGTKPLTNYKRFIRGNYITTTWFLGLLAIITVLITH